MLATKVDHLAGKRRGATDRVLDAMGLGHRATRPFDVETAKCRLCGDWLDFGTDAIGRTVERCRNVNCYNRIGHHPSSDPKDAKKPYVPRQRRKPREDLN